MLAAAAATSRPTGKPATELADDQTLVTILMILEGDALGDDVETTGQDLC